MASPRKQLVFIATFIHFAKSSTVNINNHICQLFPFRGVISYDISSAFEMGKKGTVLDRFVPKLRELYGLFKAA